MWVWTADHDIDSGAVINVTNPRGFAIYDTQGPITLVGTAVVSLGLEDVKRNHTKLSLF